MHSDNTPAAALFATNARYKREAYRGSEFAPRILAENGIDVVMKVLKAAPLFLYLGLTYSQSDHPVLNSRYLLFEAQQAYFYGLSANLALSAVTSTPAKVLGLDHRIGFIREGMYGPLRSRFILLTDPSFAQDMTQVRGLPSQLDLLY